MSNRKFVENASNCLMAVSIGIGHWPGIANLKQASRTAADDAGANPAAARLYVNLLGSHHAKLKVVNASFAAVRTYFYANTLPFSMSEGDGQPRGDRIIPVTQVPRFLAKLNELRTVAQARLDEFVPEYARLVAIAQSDDMGNWRNEAASMYPSAEDVRGRFYFNIPAPKPLPSFSPERLAKMSLPMEIAEAIAQQGADSLAAQLEVARKAAIEQAQQHMATVAKQLKDGVRLHQSLIDNGKRVAEMLRDMAQAFDRDPQVLALADMISKQVLNVETAEQWKSSNTHREAAQKAAAIVSKGLQQLAGVDRNAVVSLPKPASVGKPMARGIMGKKLAAKASK